MSTAAAASDHFSIIRTCLDGFAGMISGEAKGIVVLKEAMALSHLEF